MRLAEFIVNNVQTIVDEWESFAATLVPAAIGMSSLALRDHAREILEAAALDMGTPQTRDEQAEKSMGRAPQCPKAPKTAAQTHAVLRARSGFDINQLVAEYRALRASVLRLWTDEHALDLSGMQDMIRFNEAIDQAIAESVDHFDGQVERSRNLLLGMLGHDMRSPLNTILTTANYLSLLNAGEEVSVSAARLIRSGAAMQALLDDLVDFNRTKLGLGIRVVPADVDLRAVVDDELEQLRGAHPRRRIELTAAGDCSGWWDGARLHQLVRNLVANALRHGHPDTPVQVRLHCSGTEACLEVVNHGPDIAPDGIAHIFEPLGRGPGQDAGGSDGGLGLGLFIASEITKAHRGEIEVHSAGGETRFVVRLPRRA